MRVGFRVQARITVPAVHSHGGGTPEVMGGAPLGGLPKQVTLCYEFVVCPTIRSIDNRLQIRRSVQSLFP